jgi:DNA-binding transcriptional LysR family regulator
LRYTLRQLEYFEAVGRAGSIAAASEILNISSPSISAAITQLEEEFGLALFYREHAKGLTLTEAGERFMVQTQLMLREAEYLSTLAGEITGTAQGRLNIGCLLTFAQMVLPSLRSAFEAAYPAVSVSQRVLNQAEIFSQIRREEIDVALTYDLDIPSDLEFQPLLDLPPYVLCSETHPLAELCEIAVGDLKEHDMVLLDLPYSADYFLSFFARAGVRPRVTERTRDLSVMQSMVANGYGFSIANVVPINNQSPDGKPLRFIPLAGNAKPMRIGLLRLKSKKKSATLKVFAAHCAGMVAEERLPALRRITAD